MPTIFAAVAGPTRLLSSYRNGTGLASALTTRASGADPRHDSTVEELLRYSVHWICSTFSPALTGKLFNKHPPGDLVFPDWMATTMNPSSNRTLGSYSRSQQHLLRARDTCRLGARCAPRAQIALRLVSRSLLPLGRGLGSLRCERTLCAGWKSCPWLLLRGSKPSGGSPVMNLRCQSRRSLTPTRLCRLSRDTRFAFCTSSLAHLPILEYFEVTLIALCQRELLSYYLYCGMTRS